MAHDSMVVAGIDTGKMWLDVACYPSGEALRVENDAVGHARAAAWLEARHVTRIGLEASGGYERGVVAALRKARFEVAVVPPATVAALCPFSAQPGRDEHLCHVERSE